MQRIMDIRFIFIVAVLVVVAACGTTSPPVEPSPVTNAIPAETQATSKPTPTPTPIPTEIPATPEPPAEPEFKATLEGEALAQYERLSEGHGLDIERMARFLGTEMVTEWLAVISGPASDRFASGLEGDDRERYDSLSRLERYTFELIALIEQDLAMDWLWAGPGRLDQEGEGVGQDDRGARTPAEAFAPDIAQAGSGLPRAPIIGSEALVQYARLDSEGRAAFEFLVKAVGLEAAEEQLLPLREWNDLYFHPPPIFAAPLPSLKNALSPDEAAKLAALDQRIRDPFVENWKEGLRIRAPDPSDPSDALAFTNPKGYVVQQTEKHAGQLKEVLMALPVELPPIEEILSSEAVAQYQRLPPYLMEEFWNDVGGIYARGVTVGRGNFPPLTDSEVKEYFSTIVASIAPIKAQ